jgi:integrase
MPTLPAAKGRRGHGSVKWRGDRNQYEVRVRVRPGELPTSYYSPGPESPAAETRAHELRVAKVAASRRGERVVGRRLTVGHWLDQWLELKAGTRPATARAYASRVELYLRPELGHIKLADLEPLDVSRAMERLARRRGERVDRLSPATIDAAYRVLSAALNDARRAGKVATNAAELVSVSRDQAEIVPPSLAEIAALFVELEGDPYAPLFRTLRWTGAREGELLGLRRPELDLELGTVTLVRQRVGRLKTRSSRRTLVLPPALVDELAAMPRRIDTTLVFPSSAGTPIDPRNLLRRFDAAAARAGIHPPADADLDKYRPHDLRHAFATMLLQAGASPAIVAAWLGHGSLRMLERYAHVRPVPGGEAYREVLGAWGDETHALLGMSHRMTTKLTTKRSGIVRQ